MKITFIVITTLLALAGIVYYRTSPIREFSSIPVFQGNIYKASFAPGFDPGKKTVFIIGNNEGTEIFDIMAPFYLFNLTHKSNVFIIAPEKKPVAMMKGFFALPHFTFKEIDSAGMTADVIVIPNVSGSNKKQLNPQIVNWIKKQTSGNTTLLSICAGSFTAAATGLYDGQQMTTHASDMLLNKKMNKHALWVSNVSYTKSGNLYSTAGVSNAVEGSLVVIKDVFGEQSMLDVMDSIHYPHANLRATHQSMQVSTGDKIAIVKKSIFAKHRNIGVWLHDGIDEFNLSAILDAYHRSFPASLQTFSSNDVAATTKFGLIILPTGNYEKLSRIDELHILTEKGCLKNRRFRNIQQVHYNRDSRDYIFDVCLKRIQNQYGDRMHTVVKRLLDYN